MRPPSALALAALLCACSGLPTTQQRLTEAAHEMNNGLRFGRMDMALDRVASSARADFVKRHSQWGTAVRILDVEMAGADIRTKEEADVFLLVSWQKADESTVRGTRVSQRWKDDKGWQVVAERRIDGAYGLFGDPEPPRPQAAPAPTGRQAQFRTRVIYEEE